VIVPVREDVPAFGVQDTVTEPDDPDPLEGETLSHEPFPDAVQLPPVQPEGQPVTVTDCEPAGAVALADVGEIVKTEQVGAAVGGLQWKRGPRPPQTQFGLIVA
jgi:hypothetical protein